MYKNKLKIFKLLYKNRKWKNKSTDIYEAK